MDYAEYKKQWWREYKQQKAAGLPTDFMSPGETKEFKDVWAAFEGKREGVDWMKYWDQSMPFPKYTPPLQKVFGDPMPKEVPELGVIPNLEGLL